MAENQMNEAMEKLNRGIQESKHAAQQQAMQLAQEYFGDSVEALKQQINDNRATLRDLPEQVPGGQEEAFQMIFQELMDNYAKVEDALNEAEKNVADLDTEQIRRQGEVDASDAARREARELGIDLTEVEGTGSEGRVIIDDIKSFAEEAKDEAAEEDEAEEEPKASDAARRKAEELGVDLTQVEGTGSEGSVTVKDVTNLGDEAGEKATDLAGQATDQADGAVDQANGAVGQATDQVGEAADQADGAADQASDALSQVTDQVSGTVSQTVDQAEQAAGGNGSEEPNATNAARRKAEELGVDLSEVQGSGAGGLITIRDVTGS